MGKSKTRAQNKYIAKTYDRLYPFVPKGRKSEIQAAADAAGESLNDFIVKAIDERMERLHPPNPPFTPPPGEWCEGCKKLGEKRPAVDVGRYLNNDEGWHAWCFEHGCELDAPGGNARKCEKCLNGSIKPGSN